MKSLKYIFDETWVINSFNIFKSHNKSLKSQNLLCRGRLERYPGYRGNFKSWVPLGTGYRPNKKLWVPGTEDRSGKKFWVPMGTEYQPEKILGTDGYRVPSRKKFWVPMGTGFQPEKNCGYR